MEQAQPCAEWLQLRAAVAEAQLALVLCERGLEELLRATAAAVVRAQRRSPVCEYAERPCRAVGALLRS